MPSLRDKLAGKTTKLASTKEQLADHPASNNYENGAFVNVELDLISPDPNQPRKFFDEASLAELSSSIKQKGVLQPVIIRKGEDEKIWLVAGERRFRAAKMAGLETIPAIITTGNPAEIALIENLQRENLKPIEEAEALDRMIQEIHYTQQQLALVIGKSQSTISETLSLMRLPEAIKDEYRCADIPRRILLEVAKQKTPEEMMALLNQIKEGNLKSDQVRSITRKPRTANRPAIAVAVERVRYLTNYLEKLDLNAEQNQADKILLLGELQQLKNLIDGLMN
jgi:ParB family chromosome partitioning protein